jgi:hypothetical protein
VCFQTLAEACDTLGGEWSAWASCEDLQCEPGGGDSDLLCDFNLDGAVDVSDLLVVIGGWYEHYDIEDLLCVLENWGAPI